MPQAWRQQCLSAQSLLFLLIPTLPPAPQLLARYSPLLQLNPAGRQSLRLLFRLIPAFRPQRFTTLSRCPSQAPLWLLLLHSLLGILLPHLALLFHISRLHLPC